MANLKIVTNKVRALLKYHGLSLNEVIKAIEAEDKETLSQQKELNKQLKDERKSAEKEWLEAQAAETHQTEDSSAEVDQEEQVDEAAKDSNEESVELEDSETGNKEDAKSVPETKSKK